MCCLPLANSSHDLSAMYETLKSLLMLPNTCPCLFRFLILMLFSHGFKDNIYTECYYLTEAVFVTLVAVNYKELVCMSEV